jgi:hypothetical protein
MATIKLASPPYYANDLNSEAMSWVRIRIDGFLIDPATGVRAVPPVLVELTSRPTRQRLPDWDIGDVVELETTARISQEDLPDEITIRHSAPRGQGFDEYLAGMHPSPKSMGVSAGSKCGK